MTDTKTAELKPSPSRLGRRSFLGAVAATGAAAVVSPKMAFASPSNPASGDALVVVFLRGGADGLSMTPPYGYQTYRDLRPTIAVPPPGNPGGALPLDSSNANAVFPTGIDGVVGLHPALAPIHETLWASGNLAVIPAAGLPKSESASRSHFIAERYWERGSASSSVRSGWLNRVITGLNRPTALPGVNKAYQTQDILDGPAKYLTVPNLDSFGVGGFRSRSDAKTALRAMYGTSQGAISQTGSDLLTVVDQLEALNDAPGSGNYPGGRLARDLKQTAVMLRSGLGLQVAAIETGGWDNHSELGASTDPDSRFYKNASNLANSLRAFTDDLASDGSLNEVTILVLTEFGRTINENGSGGTDHGRATSIMAMGGGVQGGVFGDDYPDIIEDDPDEGDLTVLTDFRKPVAELLSGRVGVSNMFPTFTASGAPMGISRT